MRVLWLVSMTLPQAAAACGLGSASDVSGGWLAGQLCALRGQLDLTVCCVDRRVSRPTTGEADGVRYTLVPDVGELAGVLSAAAPDLVHIWGTEYAAVPLMQQAAANAGKPVLIGIQGVMESCAAHLCDGVPDRYLHSSFLQRWVDAVVPGALLDKSQRQFDALAEAEAAVLRDARHVTGRTAFDRDFAAKAAPNATYYPCNETLRPCFYTGTTWHARDFGAAPVLLLPQGNYPLKNLHTLLKALPPLLSRWPGLTLRIAGWPPLDKGPLLRPVIDWMFPYQRYCKQLSKSLGVAEHLQYTGPLPADAMRQAYLECDVLVLPSSSENSPNSLGEAMLLGVPCVAAAVGGIPSLLRAPEEGLLYGDALDDAALALAIAAVLSAPDGAASKGHAARLHALATHDPAANADALLRIYGAMLREGMP